jgi:sporulation protein YlmC with PRC-barrel domain
MRNKLLAAAALVVGLGGQVLAADPTGTTSPPANSLSANDLIGIAVVNLQNEKIGKVDDLLIKNRNQVALAVISVGGFLGVGDKLVAVPYENLQIVETGGEPQVVAHMTKADLEALPSFQYEPAIPAAGSQSGDTGAVIGGTQSAAVDFQTEKQRYTDEYAGKIDGWESKVHGYTDQARSAADDAQREMGDKVDAAWAEVEDQWTALQSATADSWDTTKLSFQRAWDAFAKTWDEAGNS